MNRIRELRKSHGISQEALAGTLGVQRAAISKYETGKIPLTDSAIKKLAEVFGTTADYILGHSDKAAPPEAGAIVYDDEALELMEEMHKRPELKVLFSTSMKATRDDIEAIDSILKRMVRDDIDF